MKPVLKNLNFICFRGYHRWITSSEKNPQDIYYEIVNEEMSEKKVYIENGMKNLHTIPLIKRTTKLPTLMMSKISMGHQTFLLDPPTKTWSSILEEWQKKKPEEMMVIQVYTLSGHESAIIHVVDMCETCYPGRPIRVSVRLILWL